MNLVMNGADAMNAVTGRPRILRIGSQLERRGHVAGHRQGFRHRHRRSAYSGRVFDPLFTTKCTGMGMGLSICRGIVEAHGGRLWASPAVPHGTEFRFTVPIAAVSSPPVAPA